MVRGKVRQEWKADYFKVKSIDLFLNVFSFGSTSCLCEKTIIDQLFKKVEALLSEYNRIFICDADNVTSKQFQNIRVGKLSSLFHGADSSMALFKN